MAVQTGTGKPQANPPGEGSGAAVTKQGTRPAGETYKSGPNKLTRGGLGAERVGATERTNYGQNGWAGASSAGVEESSKLSDFDITVNDPVLDQIVKQGVGRKATIDAAQTLTGQERPISDKPYPTTFGHKDPNK